MRRQNARAAPQRCSLPRASFINSSQTNNTFHSESKYFSHYYLVLSLDTSMYDDINYTLPAVRD